MSTMALVEGPQGVVAAWETEGQIYFATVTPGTAKFSTPQSASGSGENRKHPALAFNDRGEMILAWTEGTDWEKGGSLAWEVFDKSGKPSDRKGRVEDGIPVWGLPTVVSTGSDFTIIH
jgi:hypothetical protein